MNTFQSNFKANSSFRSQLFNNRFVSSKTQKILPKIESSKDFGKNKKPYFIPQPETGENYEHSNEIHVYSQNEDTEFHIRYELESKLPFENIHGSKTTKELDIVVKNLIKEYLSKLTPSSYFYCDEFITNSDSSNAMEEYVIWALRDTENINPNFTVSYKCKKIYPGDTIVTENDSGFFNEDEHIATFNKKQNPQNQMKYETKLFEHFNQITMKSRTKDNYNMKFVLQYHLQSNTSINFTQIDELIKSSVDKCIDSFEHRQFYNYKASINPELTIKLSEILKTNDISKSLKLVKGEIHYVVDDVSKLKDTLENPWIVTLLILSAIPIASAGYVSFMLFFMYMLGF